ncbi:MAG: ABC transporter permease subunit [Microbacterium sp.]
MSTIAVTAHRRHLPRAVRGALLSLLVVLAAWTIIALLFSGLRVIPTPWAVVAAFVHDLPVFPINIGATLANAAIGYVAGNLLAIVTAILFVTVRWAESLLMRIAVMTFCVPQVALVPLLVVLFPGELPKQILAGLSVYFTTLVSCLMGLRSIDTTTVQLIRSMGGGRAMVMWKARLFAMLPSLVSGLQIAAPAAVLGTILGEYLGASRGLGVLLIQSQSSFEVARTWSTALVMSGVAGILYAVIGWLGRRATPWVGKEVTTEVGEQVALASGISRGRNAFTGVLGFVGSLAIVILAWWGLFAAFGLDPYFAKTPPDVISYLVTDVDAPQDRAMVWSALVVTLGDAGIGYAIGTALACIVALLIVAFSFVELLIMPVAVVLRSVPLVAMAPLLALVFGRGLVGVTVLVSLVVFFPTLVNVATALRNAPGAACEVVVSMGGGTSLVTRKVRLIYAIPAVFASARIAVPSAVAGATLAEWLATGKGLGSALVQNFAASKFDALWSETVVLLLVSVLLYAAISALEAPAVRRIFG